MSAPPRRTQRKTHLDASAVPVERALLSRADFLDLVAQDHVSKGNTVNVTVATLMSSEFRALAEELHWW